jgi:hypothetical protein
MRYVIALAAIMVLSCTAIPAAAACRQHNDYCRAVHARHAVRVIRHQQNVEITRTNAHFKRAYYRGWDVQRLRAAVRWERSRLRYLRDLPTYVRILHPNDWACLHRFEAASWTELDNNGGVLYHGGLQMDQNFEQAYGADMLVKYHGHGAENWTPHDQMVVAQRGWFVRGYQPWSTAGDCGL